MRYGKHMTQRDMAGVCLSNTYLAFRFSINILLFGMGIDLLKYCISWCPWQRRVEVRLKYMSG